MYIHIRYPAVIRLPATSPALCLPPTNPTRHDIIPLIYLLSLALSLPPSSYGNPRRAGTATCSFPGMPGKAVPKAKRPLSLLANIHRIAVCTLVASHLAFKSFERSGKTEETRVWLVQIEIVTTPLYVSLDLESIASVNDTSDYSPLFKPQKYARSNYSRHDLIQSK